ncbi:hypothetical protein D9613_005376 [Agrocybe pediades]|uniref:Uncharacterized protein n=1 Tax=Agrocybe pediades TaxID=84607 RepID=A0A8H4QZ13_9AGAR|nr:hypothetical protein D9613_005376 [Agrocybe pediades]
MKSPIKLKRLSYVLAFIGDRDRDSSSSTKTPTRPKLARDHSDHLLSYYESSIPNETQAKLYARPPTTSENVLARNHNRKGSTTSVASSDSEYSYDSETTDAIGTVSSKTSSSLTRRSSLPSKGGADRRRVAIVQMDSVREDAPSRTSSETMVSSNTASSSIRSRRGLDSHLAGLALVAPPDAALRTYTHLTPPSTAPITADLTAQPDKTGHHRSTSENPYSKNVPSLSRDTTSVGMDSGPRGSTSNLSLSSVKSTRSSTKGTETKQDRTNALRSGLTTRDSSSSTSSRSSSPGHRASKLDRHGRSGGSGLLSPPDSAYPSALAIDMFSPIITPEIGESKEIHVPVAGPVVVNLDGLHSKTKTGTWRTDSPSMASTSSHITTSTGSYAPSAASAYLRYEPGVHATAGPLPPPPRAMFNIDISTPPPPRPPRLNSPAPPRSVARTDIEAVKQALQLPPSVTAALEKRKSTANLSNKSSDTTSAAASKDDDRDRQTDDSPESRKNETGKCSSQLSNSTSVHRREGATDAPSIHPSDASLSAESSSPTAEPTKQENLEPSPPPEAQRQTVPSSTLTSMTSTPEALAVENNQEDPVPDVTVISEAPAPRTQSPHKIDHAKFDQWLKENPLIAQPFDDARRAEAQLLNSPERRSMSPLSPDVTGDAPSPPPKSLRNSLTQNLKRFSALPRTPSLSSRSSRPSSGSTRYSSRTPSPSLHRHAPFKKDICKDPAALFCHEVYSQTTTLQRCAIYAGKINELYIHDSGLSDWVSETKFRGSNTHAHRGPSSRPFVPQPRQSSRSSVFSEATFALRPDATVATDLSQGAYGDISPTTVASSLPYPSLALNPLRSNTQPARSNSSVASGTPPSSIRSLVSTPSTKSTGFFASLGRKASLSTKRDRFPPPGSANNLHSSPSSSSSGLMSPVSSRLANRSGGSTGNGPSTLNISRPINITNPPSVPGGPRAPNYRAQRSQTFTSTFLPNTIPDIDRDQAVGRRPSLFNISPDTVIDIHPDPAFTRQVDQLAAVLPHADRDVLAGYLRRAGQDMLAIGQYLEDERMGTIRQP